MKSVKIVLVMLTASILLGACNNVEFKKTKAGVPYKIFPAGKSKDSIAVGNIVKFEMTLRIKGNGKIKDTLLSNTYGAFPRFDQVRPAAGTYEDPLMEVILMAHKGDSIYITQAVDSFIAKQPDIEKNTPFRKGDQLITTIRILDVFKTDAEARADVDKVMKQGSAEADKKLDKFIADNKIQATKTASGVYIQTIAAGTGPKPDSGLYVNVKYKGMFLDGKPFDEGVYPFQLGMQGAIPGFEEGIRNMQKGGKAKVYIPASQGYGLRGNPPRIGPNENLMFEMELLDVTSTPPQPQQMPQMQFDTTANRK